jgi:hypothetical protein
MYRAWIKSQSPCLWRTTNFAGTKGGTFCAAAAYRPASVSTIAGMVETDHQKDSFCFLRWMIHGYSDHYKRLAKSFATGYGKTYKGLNFLLLWREDTSWKCGD